MLADGGLVGTLQEAKTVGDFPVLHGVGYVGEKPDDKDGHQNAGHDLRNPLDNLDVPPDGNTLVGQEAG